MAAQTDSSPGLVSCVVRGEDGIAASRASTSVDGMTRHMPRQLGRHSLSRPSFERVWPGGTTRLGWVHQLHVISHGFGVLDLGYETKPRTTPFARVRIPGKPKLEGNEVRRAIGHGVHSAYLLMHISSHLLRFNVI